MESPTHGQQQGTVFNGHSECTCHHPLFGFNRFGDLERVLLREGNIHSSDVWRSMLEPVVARYRGTPRRFFRGDAAFAKSEVYEFLDAEVYQYAIRLPAKEVLHEDIDYLLTRTPGRPPTEPIVRVTHFEYRASTWDKPRRVVAKVEWHRGELIPHLGFIVTNLRT